MNWKEVTKEKFSEISAVSVYDVTGELTKELSDEEVTQVKLFLENVVETTEGETCGTSYYLSCTLQDEEIIFLGVSGDGCGFVATEGHLYSMANEEDAIKCVQLLKEK